MPQRLARPLGHNGVATPDPSLLQMFGGCHGCHEGSPPLRPLYRRDGGLVAQVCSRHHSALKHFEYRPEILRQAARYLRRDCANVIPRADLVPSVPIGLLTRGRRPDPPLAAGVFVKQGAGCAICNQRLRLVHDYARNGSYRGIICTGCRRSLLAYSEEPTMLLRAAGILERPGARVVRRRQRFIPCRVCGKEHATINTLPDCQQVVAHGRGKKCPGGLEPRRPHRDRADDSDVAQPELPYAGA